MGRGKCCEDCGPETFGDGKPPAVPGTATSSTASEGPPREERIPAGKKVPKENGTGEKGGEST